MITRETFKNALYFLYVEELKNLCEQLHLSNKGKKGELIQRIFAFIDNGTILDVIPFPEKSKADPKKHYPLALNTLMLIGNYKNDLKTRLFFKKVIGVHFHFTAFGIDWINEKWLDGNPPTYGEFVKFWQLEYERRKKEKAIPKQEWAYINFIQDYLIKNPDASREKTMLEWEKERDRNFMIVKNFLSKRINLHT